MKREEEEYKAIIRRACRSGSASFETGYGYLPGLGLALAVERNLMIVRGFQYERFELEGWRSEGRRTGPEGGEVTGVAREGSACEERREAVAWGIGFVVQGEGFVC